MHADVSRHGIEQCEVLGYAGNGPARSQCAERHADWHCITLSD